MQIINLSKHFGDNKAVNNISLNINKPQMIGIIGRSGAGKSTMLRIINRSVSYTHLTLPTIAKV